MLALALVYYSVYCIAVVECKFEQSAKSTTNPIYLLLFIQESLGITRSFLSSIIITTEYTHLVLHSLNLIIFAHAQSIASDILHTVVRIIINADLNSHAPPRRCCCCFYYYFIRKKKTLSFIPLFFTFTFFALFF